MAKNQKMSLNELTPVLDFLHARRVSLMGLRPDRSICSLPGLAIAPSVRKSATHGSKPHTSATATTLPLSERGRHSLLLNGDEGTLGSPHLVKSAFTLAEVLITLGVIGVVAAMTLPTLIHNYQVKQWETGLKRSYNILTNGFKKVMSDAGCMDLECTGIFVPNETNTQNTESPEFNEQMESVAKKVFNVKKVCKLGTTDAECPREYTINYLKGSGTTVLKAEKTFSMQLADGTVVYIENWGCIGNNTRKNCAYLLLDLNGYKKPNTYGKDAFELGFLKSDGSIIPNTSFYDQNNYWRKNPRFCGNADVKLKDDMQNIINGYGCLARIMENNWEMDYLK